MAFVFLLIVFSDMVMKCFHIKKIDSFRIILSIVILAVVFISCSKRDSNVCSDPHDFKYNECLKYVQSRGTLYTIQRSNILSKGLLEFVCKNSSGVKRFIVDFQNKTITEFGISDGMNIGNSKKTMDAHSSTTTASPVVKKVPTYTTDKQFLSMYAPYLKMSRNATNMTTWLDAGNLKSPVGSYGFANQHKVNNNWRDQGFLSSDYIQKMLNTVDKDSMGNPKAGYFSPAGRMMRNNVMTAFNDAASRGDMVALKDGSMAILPSYNNGRIWVFHNQNDPNPSKRGYMEQVNAFSYPELLPRLYNAYRQAISSQK